MRKNVSRSIVLFLVVGIYAALYMASSKVMSCNDDCAKLTRVDTLLQKKPYVQVAYSCKPAVLCVYVKDSVSQDWGKVADTACILVKESGLQNYSVTVISTTVANDTLAKQTCP